MTTQTTKHEYRIQKADGRYLNTGTDKPSWFTLEEARKLVNYDAGERIIWHDGMYALCETL